ncbi:MAG: glycosyl transferase [Bacillus thermozeamaize]|uniref:Glycosyl transferase n=1 Tax=Bacillus thermozeamaize TaxID=230954 RepID=A0A1Y3PMS9_9BACI|nr:MAG: glycosyl transferase [Bacillus thermozeamaize]
MNRERRKRVALFVPSLRGGGAERIMLNLAGEFAERGLNVDLILAKAEGPYLAEKHPSVRLIDLKARRVLFSLPGLVRYLRRERPVALLSALDHANLVALWARSLARVPVRVVVSVHNTVSQATARDRNKRSRWILRGMGLFYPRAEAVVAVSEGVAKDLVNVVRLSREKIRVIYNPVVTQALFVKADEPFDHPWFAPGAPPVILGVGRLTEQKDFPTLIRAFALVRKKHPARLMILGEGEERSKLETLVQELGLEKDVALPGFVNNPFKYMKRAGVFVLSSKWEGFGNVLVEAMALGTPVVSTDCPSGPAEILENGRWGRLVPVGDVYALAEAIIETLDEEHHPDVANRAKDFAVELAVEKYINVLGV